jgi:hypothetical protein
MIVVAPARLEQEHAFRRVTAQAVRQQAARRAGADDHVVEDERRSHARSLPCAQPRVRANRTTAPDDAELLPRSTIRPAPRIIAPVIQRALEASERGF